jgi:hypothetical protein
MKKLFSLIIAMTTVMVVNAQTQTATLKSASRLFATRDDLTSVITIIPADSVVSVIDSDSTYFHVTYNDSEGYIFKRQAVIDKDMSVYQKQQAQFNQQSDSQSMTQRKPESNDRFGYLENKYGPEMAKRLIAGKIWKGMTAEMVSDSWGTAQKINRVINGNVVKERWYFRNTWLYLENDILLDWGAVRR